MQLDEDGETRQISSAEAKGAASTGMCVTLGVSGWLSDHDDRFADHWQFLRQAMAGSEAHALRWESELLGSLGEAFENMVKVRARARGGYSCTLARTGKRPSQFASLPAFGVPLLTTVQ